MAHRDHLVGFYLLLTIWRYIDKNCGNVSLWPRNFILDNAEENIPMQEVIWTGTWWVMMPTRENPEVSWGAGSKCGNHINKVEVLFWPATYYFMIISYVALRRVLRGTIYVLPPSLHSLGDQALTTVTTLVLRGRMQRLYQLHENLPTEGSELATWGTLSPPYHEWS